jgi:hypothetical protein
MIKLNVNALSADGETITESLKESEADLNRHCSCPPGQSCSVEIVELPGKRFEAIVIRPGPVTESQEWTAHTAVVGMYRRLFEASATANRIREAIIRMVGATLAKSAAADVDSNGTSTKDLKIVVVDPVTVRRAQNLIVGCQVCSPFYAAIPFDSILDRVTSNDATTTRYVVAEGSAKCPRCRRHLRESTLVEFDPPVRRK